MKHIRTFFLKTCLLVLTLSSGIRAQAQTDFQAPQVKPSIPKQNHEAPSNPTQNKPKQTYTKKKARITENTPRPKPKAKHKTAKRNERLTTYIEPKNEPKELKDMNSYELEVEAAQGNVEAQYLIGERWIFADNEPDVIKGIGWLHMASEQEHSMAQALLGYVYYVLDDAETAGQFFLKSALNNNPVGMYLLGTALSTGDCGFEKDVATAAECFASAAQQEHPAAQYSLGYALYYGIGVEQNLDWAKRWMERAAYNGDEDAIAFLKENRFDVAPAM